MLFVAVGLVFGVPILWTVSVGALREARRARRLDPRKGCQAWVSVPRLPGRLYRCCEDRFAGGPWCRRHAATHIHDAAAEQPDAERIDEHQAAGRALAQARIGVPLAVAVTCAAIAGAVWVAGRAW